MATLDEAVSQHEYAAILAEYLRTHAEASLYRASLLSQHFVETGLGPEDIIALHAEALDAATAGLPYLERARSAGEAHQFLLEVMIAYGVAYRAYLDLRLSQSRRETEARAAQEHERTLLAEQSEREKSHLLAVIAHELRTPLTAALGNLDFALRSQGSDQPERATAQMQQARTALTRLARLSTDLIDASRSGTPQLAQRPERLGPLLEQACAWASVEAADQGVEFHCLNEAVDEPVRGDAGALASVLGNLISNAIRYTPVGGRVSVRRGVTADSAWIEVADSGIGMAPEVQARIFEKYYRASEAQSIAAQGLGLGLSLVQQLVAAHSGKISVVSAPGRGSTFRVELPLARAEE